MTISQGMDNLSANATQAFDTACHTAENVLKVGLDANPLYKEVSLLQQAATVLGTADPAVLRAGAEEVDAKLHQYGLLPHLHIGLDDNNNPTLTLDSKGMKTDCFGYMHVPGFGDGQNMAAGRQEQHHGNRSDASDESVNHDGDGSTDNTVNNTGDRAKDPGVSETKVHGQSTESLLQDAKQVADKVIHGISDVAKNVWVSVDPRA